MFSEFVGRSFWFSNGASRSFSQCSRAHSNTEYDTRMNRMYVVAERSDQCTTKRNVNAGHSKIELSDFVCLKSVEYTHSHSCPAMECWMERMERRCGRTNWINKVQEPHLRVAGVSVHPKFINDCIPAPWHVWRAASELDWSWPSRAKVWRATLILLADTKLIFCTRYLVFDSLLNTQYERTVSGPFEENSGCLCISDFRFIVYAFLVYVLHLLLIEMRRETDLIVHGMHLSAGRKKGGVMANALFQLNNSMICCIPVRLVGAQVIGDAWRYTVRDKNCKNIFNVCGHRPSRIAVIVVSRRSHCGRARLNALRLREGRMFGHRLHGMPLYWLFFWDEFGETEMPEFASKCRRLNFGHSLYNCHFDWLLQPICHVDCLSIWNGLHHVLAALSSHTILWLRQIWYAELIWQLKWAKSTLALSLSCESYKISFRLNVSNHICLWQTFADLFAHKIHNKSEHECRK